MKKIITVLLVLIYILSLAGCGKKEKYEILIDVTTWMNVKDIILRGRSHSQRNIWELGGIKG